MNGFEMPRLSPREQEVLRLSCQGLTDQQIALGLRIADGTVRTYVSRLKVKTGAENRTQLGILAQELGLANGHNVDGQSGSRADGQTGSESLVALA